MKSNIVIPWKVNERLITRLLFIFSNHQQTRILKCRDSRVDSRISKGVDTGMGDGWSLPGGQTGKSPPPKKAKQLLN